MFYASCDTVFLELAEIGHFLLRKDSYLLRDGLRRLSRAPQVVKKLSTIEIIQSSITTWQTLIFITWQTISKPNIFDISSPQKYIVEIFAKCWLVFFQKSQQLSKFSKIEIVISRSKVYSPIDLTFDPFWISLDNRWGQLQVCQKIFWRMRTCHEWYELDCSQHCSF